MTVQTGGAPPPASLTTTAAARAAAAPAAETRTPGSVMRRVLYFVALFGATLIFVFPFVWLVSASLKTRQTVFNTELFPFPLHFENYTRIFEVVPLSNWFINSTIISILAATTVTISSALVAFGFAYFRFPGRNVLFWLVLASMMLPGAVMMIPNFLIWNALGQVNSPTFAPLWAGNLFGSAFYIFLLRQFFLGLPRETFEAARVSGSAMLQNIRG